MLAGLPTTETRQELTGMSNCTFCCSHLEEASSLV